MVDLIKELLKLLWGFLMYDFGATKEKNKQLKENERLREKYENIDDMSISSNDVFTEWLRDSK